MLWHMKDPTNKTEKTSELKSPVTMKGMSGVILLAGIGLAIYFSFVPLTNKNAVSNVDRASLTAAISNLNEKEQQITELKQKLAELLENGESGSKTIADSLAPEINTKKQKELRQLQKDIASLQSEKKKAAKDLAKAESDATKKVSENTDAQPADADSTLSREEIISKIKPSVVQINTIEGAGSGFAVTDSGQLLTNEHVVAGTNYAEVIFSNGDSYDAYVISRDISNDLALIQVDGTDTSMLSFAQSEESALPQGAVVYAFGYPFGLEGEVSVTSGFLSRHIDIEDTNYLEISTNLQSGNSGGPLINGEGKVVGINTSVFGHIVESVVAGQGINLALPADLIMDILPKLQAEARTLTLKEKEAELAFVDFREKYIAIIDEINPSLENLNDSLEAYDDYYYVGAHGYVDTSLGYAKTGLSLSQALFVKHQNDLPLSLSDQMIEATVKMSDLALELKKILLLGKKRITAKENGQVYQANLFLIDERKIGTSIRDILDDINAIHADVFGGIDQLTDISETL